MPDYWIIKADGKSIGGLQRSKSGGRPHAGTRLYVEVTDLEETLARLEALGGRIERTRTELGGDDRCSPQLSTRPVSPSACGLHTQQRLTSDW